MPKEPTYGQKSESGLSDENQRLIVALAFLILLVFGPLEPYGQIIRLAYVIFIPALLWLALRRWGPNWKMDHLSNERLYTAIFAAIAGAFLVSAYLSLTASYHTECYPNSGSGIEACRTVKGTDPGTAFIKGILALLTFSIAVLRQSKND